MGGLAPDGVFAPYRGTAVRDSAERRPPQCDVQAGRSRTPTLDLTYDPVAMTSHTDEVVHRGPATTIQCRFR